MNRSKTFQIDIGWRTLLKDMGLSVARVLRRAGLPADLLSRVGEALRTEDYFRFWRALEDEAADPLFPLRMVQSVTAEVFSPPIFAALCSANLMQAVQRLARYKQLVAPMALDVEVRRSGELTLSPRWLSAQTNTPTSLQVAEVAFLLKLAQLATREPVKASREASGAAPDRVRAPIREVLWRHCATRRRTEYHLLRRRCPAAHGPERIWCVEGS